MRPRTPELDQRILDVAASRFASSHFHEVRMEDIAAAVGVAKGTLYRYFRDKEELYLALLQRAASQIGPFLEEQLASAITAEDRLIALCHAVLAFFDDQPHIFELIQQVEARLGTDHPWQPARDFIIRLVVRLFKEGKAAKEFTITQPKMTALILLGGLRAIFRFGEKPRPRSLSQKLVRTVLYGANQTDRSETNPTDAEDEE